MYKVEVYFKKGDGYDMSFSYKDSAIAFQNDIKTDSDIKKTKFVEVTNDI